MTVTIKPAFSPSDEPFEFKSAALNLIAFTPHTADLARLASSLQRKLAIHPGFFGDDAVVMDLSALPAGEATLDLAGLLALLGECGLRALAVRGAPESLAEAVSSSGLISLPAALDGPSPAPEPAPKPEEAAPPATAERLPPAPALIIDKPVRSGQQVYARGGDLVVLALVSHGAEVIADGNVHVYAPLRGRALAGARGQSDSRIFTYCLEAELLSIAGVYRTLEEALPASLKGKPAQVKLDGSKLVIEALTLN